VLASEFTSRPGELPYPATEAGLKTGDYITAVDAQPIKNFRDLQDAVAMRAEKPITVDYTRDGVSGSLRVTPYLNKKTGAGGIGVYPWVEPVVAAVVKDSAADIAGLSPGDRIISANGREIPHTRFLDMLIEESPFQTLNLLCERSGKNFETKMILYADAEGRLETGISFRAERVSSLRVGPGEAFAKGLGETLDTLEITVTSLGLLFRGIDLSQAVSGPLRITYFVGEVAAQGFSKNFATGVTSILNFLSLLSVALFFMNLLPIPLLDGGLIILFLFEIIRGKALSPRFVYRYQFVGLFFIILLVILSTMSDVLYFFRG
jgi:regulator of sigma E protease